MKLDEWYSNMGGIIFLKKNVGMTCFWVRKKIPITPLPLSHQNKMVYNTLFRDEIRTLIQKIRPDFVCFANPFHAPCVSATEVGQCLAIRTVCQACCVRVLEIEKSYLDTLEDIFFQNPSIFQPDLGENTLKIEGVS